MSNEMLNSFDGMKSVHLEAEIPTTRGEEEIARALEYGLEAAPSIKEAPIMNATITALRLALAAASRDLVIICATRFSASGAASPVRISTKRTR